MLDTSLLEEKGLYEIDYILASKRRKNKMLYLVKWKGYDVKESTWESTANLKTVRNAISEFEESHMTIKQKQSGEAVKKVKTKQDKPSQPKKVKKGAAVNVEASKSSTSKERSENDSTTVTVGKQLSKKMQKSQKMAEKKAVQSSTTSSNESKVSTSKDIRKPSAEPEQCSMERQTSFEFVSKTIASDDPSLCTAGLKMCKKEEDSDPKEIQVTEIRMLLKEKMRESQEYLVKLSDGKVQVLSSLELLQRYPLEMVSYLENRVSPK